VSPLRFPTSGIRAKVRFVDQRRRSDGEYDSAPNPEVDKYKLWELEHPDEGSAQFSRYLGYS